MRMNMYYIYTRDASEDIHVHIASRRKRRRATLSRASPLEIRIRQSFAIGNHAKRSEDDGPELQYNMIDLSPTSDTRLLIDRRRKTCFRSRLIRKELFFTLSGMFLQIKSHCIKYYIINHIINYILSIVLQ